MWKDAQPSLASKEMQLKIPIRIPIRIVKIQKSDNTKC